MGTWLSIHTSPIGTVLPCDVRQILKNLESESENVFKDYVSALEISFPNYFFKMLSITPEAVTLSRFEASCGGQEGMGKDQTG
jgi:hypothetical protein